jgi:hypothetical protein
MKYISPLFSDARNKLGGSVFARNRSGVYVRAKVSPEQPRTVSQQTNRALFAELAGAWKTLSQADIAAWNSSAAATTLHDSLGHSFSPSGFQLYLSCNKNLRYLGQPTIPAPVPRSEDTEGLSTTEPYYDVSSGTLDAARLFFENDNNTSPFFFIVKASPNVSPGINFVGPGQLRNIYADQLEGNQYYDFSAAYNTLFPASTIGAKIACTVTLIDSASGLAGTPQSFLTVIT